MIHYLYSESTGCPQNIGETENTLKTRTPDVIEHTVIKYGSFGGP